MLAELVVMTLLSYYKMPVSAFFMEIKAGISKRRLHQTPILPSQSLWLQISDYQVELILS